MSNRWRGDCRGIADMTPNARAMILAEQLSELHAGRWPFLLEAAIRDAENEIVALEEARRGT